MFIYRKILDIYIEIDREKAIYRSEQNKRRRYYIDNECIYVT